MQSRARAAMAFASSGVASRMTGMSSMTPAFLPVPGDNQIRTHGHWKRLNGSSPAQRWARTRFSNIEEAEPFPPPITCPRRRFRDGGSTPHFSGFLEDDMDDKRIEGRGHEVKGAIREAVGDVTGNRSQQIKGNVEKNAGKAEQMIGELADRQRRNEAQPPQR